MPWRVLYVETTRNLGGSLISLYYLLRDLDRDRYQPVVLLPPENPWLELFRALGCEVIVADPHLPVTPPAVVRRIRGSAVSRGVRRFAWGRWLYHQLGFCLKLVREILPRAQWLRRLIHERKIDWVHTNWFVARDRAAIFAAHLAGIPCVCHIRAFEKLNGFDRLLTTRWVDAFIFISHALERDYREQGVRIKRGIVVYNGLDLAEFPENPDRSAVRAELGLSPANKVVGVVGRLEPWKGQHYFIQAVHLVRRRFPDLKALIVGPVEPHAQAYYQELRELVETLGLSQQVIFTGRRDDLPHILGALDLLVHSSADPEPFGRVVIEGMAAGLPVIGMDAGAIPEIIEDGVNGVLVPPRDVEAMAETICALLADPQWARALGHEARQRVAERFTVEQYVTGVERVYEAIIGEE